MKKALLIAFLAVLLVGCIKTTPSIQGGAGSLATTLTLLQNKWIIDSVSIYGSSNITGAALFTFRPLNVQYEDFRADGKVYSYGGEPVSSYDTSLYRVLPDNTTFIVNLVTGGVAPRSDTGYIMKLTAKTLIYYNRNGANDYGKWMLKR